MFYNYYLKDIVCYLVIMINATQHLMFLTLNVIPNEKGGQVSLHPYDMIVSGAITVNPDQVIWTADPDQKLLNQYQEVFSAIITPPKGTVTPIK